MFNNKFCYICGTPIPKGRDSNYCSDGCEKFIAKIIQKREVENEKKL